MQWKAKKRQYSVIVKTIREIEGVAHVLRLWDEKDLTSYNSWMIPRGNQILKSPATSADSSGG